MDIVSDETAIVKDSSCLRLLTIRKLTRLAEFARIRAETSPLPDSCEFDYVLAHCQSDHHNGANMAGRCNGAQIAGQSWPPNTASHVSIRRRRIQVLVEHIALPGNVAGLADGAFDLFQRQMMNGAGGRDDVLLDHQAAHVVGAEKQRELTDLQSLSHPRGLNVRNVVEIEPGDCLRA